MGVNLAIFPVVAILRPNATGADVLGLIIISAFVQHLIYGAIRVLFW